MPLFFEWYACLHGNDRSTVFLFFRQVQGLKLDLSGNADIVFIFVELTNFFTYRMIFSVDQQNLSEIRLRIRHQNVFLDCEHRFGLFGHIGHRNGRINRLLARGNDHPLLRLLCRNHCIIRYFFFIGHSFSPFQTWSCYNLFSVRFFYAKKKTYWPPLIIFSPCCITNSLSRARCSSASFLAFSTLPLIMASSIS